VTFPVVHFFLDFIQQVNGVDDLKSSQLKKMVSFMSFMGDGIPRA